MKIIIILLVFTTGAIAQNIPIHTNYGTVNYMYIPNKSGGGSNSYKTKFNYEINLITDSSLSSYSKVEFYKDSCAFIEVKENKEKNKVYPSQTKEVKYDDSFGNKFVGIPVGNYWYFKIINGKINGFSLTPKDDEYSLKYVQKGLGGEYLEANQINVLKIVAGKEKAVKYATKNKLYKAIIEYNKN